MRLLLSILSLFVVSTSFSQTEEKELNPEELYFKDLVEAYNFLITQEEALKAVSTQHPDLAGDVELLLAEQSASSLGKAMIALKETIKERLQEKWQETDQLFRKRVIKDHLSKAFSEDTAQTMLRQYGKVKDGLVPTEILRTIVSLHPEYVDAPVEEIKAGWVQPFQETSGGKEFKWFFPGSWKPKELKNKHNLGGATHKAGHGICTLSVTAIPVAPQLYEQEYAKHSPVELAKLLIPKQTKIVSTKEVDFVNTKGGFSIYDIPKTDPPKARVMQYAAYQEEHFVLFQLTFALKPGHDVDFLSKKFKPVLISCAESLEIK